MTEARPQARDPLLDAAICIGTRQHLPPFVHPLSELLSTNVLLQVVKRRRLQRVVGIRSAGSEKLSWYLGHVVAKRRRRVDAVVVVVIYNDNFRRFVVVSC